jgi:lysophospholipase L1-like esterase
MRATLLWLAAAVLAAGPTVWPAAADSAEPFELHDGDRVVLIGGTLMERDQTHGFLEARLLARWPQRKIIFRNLGWSGDTVWGEARAGFDTPKEGFQRLRDHVLGLQPSVIVIGYGSNEAFAGAGGVAAFESGMETLLKALAPAKARVVLLAPPRHENLGPPLPSPRAYNAGLPGYCDVLRRIAAREGFALVDLYEHLVQPSESPVTNPLTENGMHFGARGYSRLAAIIEEELGLPPRTWRIELNGGAKPAVVQAQGVEVTRLAGGGNTLSWESLDAMLPPANSGDAAQEMPSGRVLKVSGLGPGKYRLRVDRQEVAAADAAAWAAGVEISRGPEFDQAQELRRTIVLKNRLYFYRWRPQNETYLFGFRKHEQGQNAREVPMFDPLVEEQETVIDKLRRPIKRYYELLPVAAD